MELYHIKGTNLFDSKIHTDLVYFKPESLSYCGGKIDDFYDGIYHMFLDNSASMAMDDEKGFFRIKKKLVHMIKTIQKRTTECAIHVHTFSTEVVELNDASEESIMSIDAFGVSNYDLLCSTIQSIISLTNDKNTSSTITDMRIVIIGDGQDTYSHFHDTTRSSFINLPLSMPEVDAEFRVRFFCYSVLNDHQENSDLHIICNSGNVVGNFYRKDMWNVFGLINPLSMYSDSEEVMQDYVPLANGKIMATVLFKILVGDDISMNMYENYMTHYPTILNTSTNYTYSFVTTMCFIKRTLEYDSNECESCIEYLLKYYNAIETYQSEPLVYLRIITLIIELIMDRGTKYNYLDSKKYGTILSNHITEEMMQPDNEYDSIGISENATPEMEQELEQEEMIFEQELEEEMTEMDVSEKQSIEENIYDRLKELSSIEALVAVVDISKIYVSDYCVYFGTIREMMKYLNDSEEMIMVPLRMSYGRSQIAMCNFSIFCTYQHYVYVISHFIAYSHNYSKYDKRELLYDLINAGRIKMIESNIILDETADCSIVYDYTYNISRILLSFPRENQEQLKQVVIREYLSGYLNDNCERFHEICQNGCIQKTMLDSIGPLRDFSDIEKCIYEEERASFVMNSMKELTRYENCFRRKFGLKMLTCDDLRLWDDPEIPSSAGVPKHSMKNALIRRLREEPITIDLKKMEGLIELINVSLPVKEWDTLSMILSYFGEKNEIVNFHGLFSDSNVSLKASMLIQLVEKYKGVYIDPLEYLRQFRTRVYLSILDRHLTENMKKTFECIPKYENDIELFFNIQDLNISVGYLLYLSELLDRPDISEETESCITNKMRFIKTKLMDDSYNCPFKDEKKKVILSNEFNGKLIFV